MEPHSSEEDPIQFAEFRRKFKTSDVLSASTVKLMGTIGFTGRLCIIVQNGKVLKSGYEEGYFCHRSERTDKLQ